MEDTLSCIGLLPPSAKLGMEKAGLLSDKGTGSSNDGSLPKRCNPPTTPFLAGEMFSSTAVNDFVSSGILLPWLPYSGSLFLNIGELLLEPLYKEPLGETMGVVSLCSELASSFSSSYPSSTLTSSSSSTPSIVIVGSVFGLGEFRVCSCLLSNGTSAVFSVGGESSGCGECSLCEDASA